VLFAAGQNNRAPRPFVIYAELVSLNHLFLRRMGISYMQDSDNAAALAAKGYNVGPVITRLQGALTLINPAMTEHTKREAALQEQTKIVEGLLGPAYTDASGAVDGMAGAHGKTSPAGKKVLDIRSKIRQGPQGPGKKPAQPCPACFVT